MRLTFAAAGVCGLLLLLLHATLPALAAQAQAQAQAAVPVLLCVTCRVNREPHSMHAEFAARHFAHEYPRLAVSTKLVGRYEAGGTTTRGLVGAKVANGTGCQVLIGPGSSGIAAAMNPLVNEYWMDYSATSTELSSRFNYPLFSRVVPTDADATSGWAPLLRELDWTAFGIVCANTAYGRSVAAGMANVLETVSGTKTNPACVPVESDEAAAEAELARIKGEGHRIAVVAMASTTPLYDALIAAILRTRAFDDTVFLFCESACSSTAQTWQRVPGAFCGTFAVSPETIGPFLTSYTARDTSAARAAYAAMGWPPGSFSLTATGVYPAYATDATRFTLRALDAYVSEHGSLPPSIEEGTAYIRNYSMPGGASGTVRLTEGNRAAADMVIFNSAADGSTIRVAANSTATGTVSIASQLTLFGRDGYTLDTVPAIRAPTAPAAEDRTTLIIVVVTIVVVVCAVLIVAAVVLVLGGGSDQRGPSFEHCPLNDSEPFAVLFAGVANEAALNDAYTEESVALAMAAVAKAVRGAVRETLCHEAQRVDDGTFMIVGKTPECALQCAAAISAAVNGATAGNGVNAPFVVAASTLLDTASDIRSTRSAMVAAPASGRDGAAKRSPKPKALNASRNGDASTTSTAALVAMRPTVRMTLGVAYGFGTIDHDAEHGILSYRGPVLGTAAAATDAGVAGQIVATERIVDAVAEDSLDVPGSFCHYLDPPEGCDAAAASTGAMHTYTPYALSPTIIDRVAVLVARKQMQQEQQDGDGGSSQPGAGKGAGGGPGLDVDQTVSIAAALSRAETGVAPRRCAVAMVSVQALGGGGGAGSDPAKQATAALRTIIAAARRHKCHVHDIVGTSVVVTANAVGPAVTMAPMRVAQFAREVVEASVAAADDKDYISGKAPLSGRHGVTVGIAAGSVVAAGVLEATTVVGGSLANQARLALAAGFALELPIVLALSGTTQHESDVDSHYLLVPVDAATTTATTTTKAPQRPPKTSLLCSVEHPREQTDEWLYAFDKGGDEQQHRAPATWKAFLDGDLPPLGEGDDGDGEPGAVVEQEAPSPMATAGAEEEGALPGQPGPRAQASAPPPSPSVDIGIDALLLKRSIAVGRTRLDAARRESGATPTGYPEVRCVQLVGALGAA